VLLRRPIEVLIVVLVIMVGKSLAALAIVRALRYPLRTALVVSAGLSQIGELSFILIALGITLKLVPAPGRDLVLAGALVSITLNPAMFGLAERLARRDE
jgi:CPA2 family monovalent cation:H+ antiporter-2